MKKTIVDVAEYAGCSIATVSRVMNGNYPVSEAMREKVEEAIDKLGFVPNIQASEIKKKKSKTIGVIVPSVDNLFFAEVIKGIEENISKSGYSLILSFSNNEQSQEVVCFSNLVKRNVAGIIFADPDRATLEGDVVTQMIGHTPIVLINGDSQTKNFSFVQTDEFTAAKEALSYLWNQSKKKICFFRGSKSYSYDVKERAYLEFMKEKGLDASLWVYDVGAGNNTEVIEQSKQLFLRIQGEMKFDAALCCNDLMAVGVLKAAKMHGIKVPDTLSIIGFDNTLLCEITEPKLTSVDQHMRLIGNEAAKLLLENIGSKELRSKRVVLSTDLVIRKTA